MARLPTKLRQDAILEALVELRFQHEELGEVAMARLADLPSWKGFKVDRLPGSGLPQEIRMADKNLFFQPSVQLSSVDGHRLVRIGPNVMSFHNLKSYIGWNGGFRDEVVKMASSAFKVMPSLTIERIGLRYVNMFTRSRHQIDSINDLDFSISAGGMSVSERFHLSYGSKPDLDHEARVQIASPDSVTGDIPTDSVVLLDIDIFSANECVLADKTSLSRWLTKAHRFKNEIFFSMLPNRIVEKLAIEWSGKNA